MTAEVSRLVSKQRLEEKPGSKLRCLIAIVRSRTTHDRPYKLQLQFSVAYTFHHGEMLEVIVSLEKSISSEEFDQYATNTPDITWIAPPEIEDDFRSPIVSGRNDRGVILIIEGRRAKVYQSYLGIEKDSTLSGNSVYTRRRRGYLTVVGECLISIADK